MNVWPTLLDKLKAIRCGFHRSLLILLIVADHSEICILALYFDFLRLLMRITPDLLYHDAFFASGYIELVDSWHIMPTFLFSCAASSDTVEAR